MKQYRITSADLNQTSDEDCHLAPDDPIHELKALSGMGGLGGAARLHELRANQGSNISVAGNERGQYMKDHNIKPGTPEWFRLWFSLPHLTGDLGVGNKK
jgi:hypothetical protein